MKDSEIEMLWKYVDDTCTQAEREEVVNKLSNPEWQRKLEEITQLGLELHNLDPIEAPPQLTENVMNAIAAKAITGKTTDVPVIFGIAAFLIFIIAVGLLQGIYNQPAHAKINWNFNLGQFFNRETFLCVAGVNIIVALALADKILSGRRML